MAHPQSFFWYDLMTDDRPAAEAFYGAVVGWEREPFPMQDGGTYTVLKVGDQGVAGIMDMPEEARSGGGPRWQGYVYAADVDAKVAEIVGAGGAVHRQPWDVPDVGRMAVVADPQGAAFLVMAPAGPERPPIPAGIAGTIGWHELHAVDWRAALDFYAARFGWAKDRAVEMGPDFIYQLFTFGSGEAVGGMMNKMEMTPAPVWIFYFRVPEAQAATARVRESGGTVVHGPVEVPGGDWIVQCRDPQGAHFALVASKP